MSENLAAIRAASSAQSQHTIASANDLAADTLGAEPARALFDTPPPDSQATDLERSQRTRTRTERISTHAQGRVLSKQRSEKILRTKERNSKTPAPPLPKKPRVALQVPSPNISDEDWAADWTEVALPTETGLEDELDEEVSPENSDVENELEFELGSESEEEEYCREHLLKALTAVFNHDFSALPSAELQALWRSHLNDEEIALEVEERYPKVKLLPAQKIVESKETRLKQSSSGLGQEGFVLLKRGHDEADTGPSKRPRLEAHATNMNSPPHLSLARTPPLIPAIPPPNFAAPSRSRAQGIPSSRAGPHAITRPLGLPTSRAGPRAVPEPDSAPASPHNPSTTLSATRPPPVATLPAVPQAHAAPTSQLAPLAPQAHAASISQLDPLALNLCALSIEPRRTHVGALSDARADALADLRLRYKHPLASRTPEEVPRHAPAPHIQQPDDDLLPNDAEVLALDLALATQQPTGGRKKKPTARRYNGNMRLALTIAFIDSISYAYAEGPYENRQTYRIWAREAYYRAWQKGLPKAPYEAPPEDLVELIVNRLATQRNRIKERMRPLIRSEYEFRHPVLTDADLEYNLAQFTSLYPNSFHCRILSPRQDPYENPIMQRALGVALFHSPEDFGVLYSAYFDPLPLTTMAFVLTCMQFCINEYSTGRFVPNDLHVTQQAHAFMSHMEGFERYARRASHRLARFQHEWFAYGWVYSGAERTSVAADYQELTRLDDIRADTPLPSPAGTPRRTGTPDTELNEDGRLTAHSKGKTPADD